MSSPELSVVCRSCGSEVSPYVTECPYCGTRIRKRAPKLERHGDELQARESRGDRRRRARAQRASRIAERAGERPYATIAAVLLPALAVLVMRAGAFDEYELGAIVGSVGDEWWRYLAAPWIYPDVGYLFAVSLGIVIFGMGVERRVGTPATAVLMLASGALGMLAAAGIDEVIDPGGLMLAAGGNAVALGLLGAWATLVAAEMRSPDSDAEPDVIGAAVCAAVLLMLPLVEDFANVFAGIAGAAVGAACGWAAARARARRRPAA